MPFLQGSQQAEAACGCPSNGRLLPLSLIEGDFLPSAFLPSAAAASNKWSKPPSCQPAGTGTGWLTVFFKEILKWRLGLDSSWWGRNNSVKHPAKRPCGHTTSAQQLCPPEKGTPSHGWAPLLSHRSVPPPNKSFVSSVQALTSNGIGGIDNGPVFQGCPG